jgi:hypothetical protein
LNDAAHNSRNQPNNDGREGPSGRRSLFASNSL